jgi:hypothetical protein
MGTVEWSELLRWVPCGAQENPGQEFQTSSPCEAADAVCVEVPRADRASLTLASL